MKRHIAAVLMCLACGLACAQSADPSPHPFNPNVARVAQADLLRYAAANLPVESNPARAAVAARGGRPTTVPAKPVSLGGRIKYV